MLEEELPVTFDILHRFLTPVLSDHSNNLVHHISYNKVEILEEILAMPGFEHYYDQKKKMFPIFYNFYGET